MSITVTASRPISVGITESLVTEEREPLFLRSFDDSTIHMIGDDLHHPDIAEMMIRQGGEVFVKPKNGNINNFKDSNQ